MWMQDQIQNSDFVLLVCTEIYLRRVEAREEPGKGRGVLWEAKLIYNSTYSVDVNVQKFIPVLFADCLPSFVPLALQGLTRYQIDTATGYEDLYRHLTNQPRYEVPAIGKLVALPAKPPISYPGSLGAVPAPQPDAFEQRCRQAVIKRVRHDWIEGVLNQSLYKVARLELGFTDKSEMVEQPLNAVVQVPDREPRPIPAGVPISQVFDEHNSGLLILGAPGSGKTTLLLELARDLLLRAESDWSQPIPVVFNLSSWAVHRERLFDWLVSELHQRNEIPKKLARQWLESERILPLLDGLDEVAAAYRDACVEAINGFRRDHGLLPIAVCSRIADHKTLGAKLRLPFAVEVQSLTRTQVEEYLHRAGQPMEGLRATLAEDPLMWELLETPLMLWVAMLTYRDGSSPSTPSGNLQQRRSQLFRRFVEAMFRRRASKIKFGPDQTTRWLSSLAYNLTANNQTIFYLESIDYKWLPTRRQQRLALVGVVASSMLISGLIVAPIFGPLVAAVSPHWINGLFTGLIFGLIFGSFVGLIGGLIGTVIKVQPVERLTFSWGDISSRRSKAIRSGLKGGLTGGLIVGLTIGLGRGLIQGLRTGLIYGLAIGLIVGLIRLLTTDASPETRSDINQGTKRSIKMSVLFLLIGGLIGGLMGDRSGGIFSRLVDGPVLGLIVGLFVGLIFGGLFALRHLVVRFFLWKNSSAPLRYAAFLENAKQLLFLRQVGGGYIFVHRLLREYFVSLYQLKEAPKAMSDIEPS
jgi:hypothetical protein